MYGKIPPKVFSETHPRNLRARGDSGLHTIVYIEKNKW